MNTRWILGLALVVNLGCSEPAKPERASATTPIGPLDQAAGLDRGFEARTPPLVRRHVPEVSKFDVVELPPGWRVPTLVEQSPCSSKTPVLAIQRDGIYFDERRVADLADAAASEGLANIAALNEAITKVGASKSIEQIQVFADPTLATGTILRVFASARRAGAFWQTLVTTTAPTTAYATHELVRLQLPPVGSIPAGWFELVVDVGATEIRIGKVSLVAGTKPISGNARGVGSAVTWLASEPRGVDELDRLARRLAVLTDELRAIDPDQLRAVHLSSALDRPFAELVAVIPTAEARFCPIGVTTSCDFAGVVLHVGPPPELAVDEIAPTGWRLGE